MSKHCDKPARLRRRRPARPGDRRASATGFTLLEVMLAVTLVVGIAGTAFGFFQYISGVRSRTVTRMDELRHARLAMERITDDLTAAFQLEETMQATMRMDSDAIEFAATVPQVASAWADDRAASEAVMPSFDLRIVRYMIATAVDDDGNEVNGGLIRLEDKLIFHLADQGLSDPAAGTPVRLPDIKFLRFRYYESPSASLTSVSGGVTQNGWRGQWSAPTLPDAVEVTLGFTELADGQEIDDYLETREHFTRVIHLPGAAVARLP